MDDALTTYRAALDYLFARTTGGSKLGLERTLALLDAVGNPHRRLRAFHIAGTNGKGSVAATLDVLLRARGLRVGRYTSPHLVDFRERVLVDGRPIPPEAVVEWIERWAPTVERLGATFFEATTVLAFDWLERSGVDAAVVETGLGGRLDSTNVLQPLVAGVTSIGRDHTEYLGETLEEIAGEKAGIFKAGAPAVIGELDPGLRERLAAMARERGARPVLVAADVWPIDEVQVGAGETRFRLRTPEGDCRLATPLVGRHQAQNAVTALLMLRAAGAPYAAPLDEVQPALARVRLPGRFQRVGKHVFDVAHNPDGAAVLAATLRAVDPPRPVVALLTVLRDKDWRGMMERLAPVVDAFVLTAAPTAPESRAWEPSEPLAFARDRGWAAELVPDFDAALAAADARGATVVVTGSFHTVGDAMVRLQVDPIAG